MPRRKQPRPSYLDVKLQDLVFKYGIDAVKESLKMLEEVHAATDQFLTQIENRDRR